MLELLGQAEILEILKRIEILIGLNVLVSALIVIFAFFNILRFRVKDDRGRDVLQFCLSQNREVMVVIPAVVVVIIILLSLYRLTIRYLDILMS